MKKMQFLTLGIAAAMMTGVFAGVLAGCGGKEDITITSGKVDAKTQATVTGFSCEWTGTDYVDKMLKEGPEGMFQNGGSYSYKNDTLTLDHMAPGDGVKVVFNVTNDSTVAIKYNVRLNCTAGSAIFPILTLTVNGAKLTAEGNVATSEWVTVAAEGEIAPVEVVVRLPIELTSEYQDLTNCTIGITLNAVQSNVTD